jgi:retron-type reverse transcriptase
MIIEPIFEADFEGSSYGFRPNRSSKDAMKAIKEHLQQGKTKVLDADLSKYFDSIPHDKLMISLKERIADPRILKLISKWLKAPVFEEGKFTGGKKNRMGTPQGGVISPLLANIYLHLIDRITWSKDSSVC